MSILELLLDHAPQILSGISILTLSWLVWRWLKPRNQHSLRSVAILVLGDIGRSPRMMYHAQSFAENGFMTELIGYGGSEPIPALKHTPRVRFWHIPEVPWILRRLPFIIGGPFKVIHQVTHILLCLFVWIEVPPEFILIQNPPSIPTLAVAQLVGRIRGSKVIIDWHNLGYSILALKLGNDHLLVRVAKWFEETFGYSAYAHIFVTRAMRDHLVKEWDLQGKKVVLHDRPPRHFHRASISEIHELFRKLQPTISNYKPLQDFLPKSSPPYSTPLTQAKIPRSPPARGPSTFASKSLQNRPPALLETGASADQFPMYSEIQMPTLRPDRPAVLVSSTSWTPDEDFSILLDALKVYELRARELFAGRSGSPQGRLPKLLVIVTGKGPLREKYMSDIAGLQKDWKWVRCISMWLEAVDYPTLLGSADLGVSLHSSSSSLDLPMKVVDMFGCGLPVCALQFSCLDELVKNGVNGLVFKDAAQLAEQLEEVFLSFPDAPRLHALTESLNTLSQRPSTPSNPHVSKRSRKQAEDEKSFRWTTWEDNWGRLMRPLILSDVNL